MISVLIFHLGVDGDLRSIDHVVGILLGGVDLLHRVLLDAGELGRAIPVHPYTAYGRDERDYAKNGNATRDRSKPDHPGQPLP